ncbi:MAG: hypothetical protein DSZ03_00970 [Sulfurimonas sp.]|nr:MAG: hypothetical protein DSZ03_00970 [Sulfurimonas sp.]
MKQSIVVLVLATLVALFSGCSKSNETPVSTEVVVIESGVIAPNITIGEPLNHATLSDQFDKEHTLTEANKVIFAFTKDMGHVVTDLLKSKPDDYLSSKNIFFVADMSKMPSLIYKMAVLPDLEDLNYPILIILDEEKGAGYRNANEGNRIMVIDLEGGNVTKATFLATTDALLKAIE